MPGRPGRSPDRQVNFGPTILWNCDPSAANSCQAVLDSDRDEPDDKGKYHLGGPYGIQESAGRIFFTRTFRTTSGILTVKLYSCDPSVAGGCYSFQQFN